MSAWLDHLATIQAGMPAFSFGLGKEVAGHFGGASDTFPLQIEDYRDILSIAMCSYRYRHDN
jgi:hypothetical protein